jgi:phage baseplate assembly protein W
MALEDNYIGRGWSFPPRFQAPTFPPVNNQLPPDGGVEVVSGLTDIDQSLYILFTTHLGERVMQPDYGTELHQKVFEAFDAGLQAQLQRLVTLAVLDHEPRINVVDVTVSESEDVPGMVLIDLLYQVRSTNARHNYVYPFYLQEGSELNATPAAS